MGNRVKNNNKKSNTKWIIKVILWSMIICGSISLCSDLLLKKFNILVAFIILIFIILIGVFFDILGVAVTAADEAPFHSMASKKINGAKLAIKLIKNADRTSSICNDIIGDVCGIISGAIGISIVNKVVLIFTSVNVTIISTIIGVLIGGFTVGGKAMGKKLAINKANDIVFKICKIIYFLKKDR